MGGNASTMSIYGISKAKRISHNLISIDNL
jgi:hypothetical protein